MALQKKDYDEYDDVFIIRRAFSNKKLIGRTKTKQIHFFFVNPYGKLRGKNYQHDYLVDLWSKACDEVGENIGMYAGLKHSSCSQYINEKGLSVDELQMITDHARRESVLKYAKVQAEAKGRLMMGKLITIPILSPRKKRN